MEKIVRCCVLACLLAVAGPAAAQAWPAKTVRLIVSTGSGTSPDRIARLAADRLSRELSTPVVVENLTGAGGLIATRAALRAAPDGYTLFFAGVGALVTDPYTVKDLGYDPDTDFTFISMIYEEGLMGVAVHPSVPATTLPELMALAKKDPGKLSYGTTSVNYIIHFGRWLTKLGGADMLAVAYKSPAQQMQDVLSGRIHAIITSPPTLEPHLKAGKLRVVAVDGGKRFPAWPETPTVSETFPGFRLSGVGVLVGPRGIPREVVDTARAAMDRVVTARDYQQALVKMGFTVENAGTPESIRELLRERRAYWRQVFDGLGVKPE
jgi:tripartite-type tricarboxylate transporter receptor subunit TctC